MYTNKPPKMGIWSRPSENHLENASAQSRDGLAYAIIEGKNKETRETVILAECKGSEYVMHRWIAAVSTPLSVRGKLNIQGSIQGMTLVTIDFKYHVQLDGIVVKEANNEGRSNYA